MDDWDKDQDALTDASVQSGVGFAHANVEVLERDGGHLCTGMELLAVPYWLKKDTAKVVVSP